MLFSEEYQDFYFSNQGAAAESEHVFLHGAEVQSRLQTQKRIRVGELGFGTGLNFFQTWKAFLESPCEYLVYHAFEKHLLPQSQMQRFWRNEEAFDSKLRELAQSFIEKFTIPTWGTHSFESVDGRVLMVLHLGDVKETLSEAEFRGDAWYLDGFSPQKNPEMWSESTLREVTRLSGFGTHLSTFTAAGSVRRTLSALGWDVRKIKGFGSKREMTIAALNRESVEKTPSSSLFPYDQKPWARWPEYEIPTGASVAVVGAGLGGTALAAQLAKRGFHVQVFDKSKTVASGASNQGFALAVPSLAREKDAICEFSLLGYSRWLQGSEAGEPTSVLHLGHKEGGAEIQKSLGLSSDIVRWVSAEEAKKIAGISLSSLEAMGGCLYFPKGFWVNAKDLCRSRIEQQSRVEFFPEHELVGLRDRVLEFCFRGERVTSDRFSAVFLSTAQIPEFLAPRDLLPNHVLRGQNHRFSEVPELRSLRSVVSYDGVITPAFSGVHFLGSTFQRNDFDSTLRIEDQMEILHRAENVIGFPMDSLRGIALEGAVGFRSTTPDTLPWVGPLPSWNSFLKTYWDLRHGRKKPYLLQPVEEGVFVLGGLGSKGLVYGAMGAHVLSRWIAGDGLVMPRRLWEPLSLGRFSVRKIRRNARDLEHRII